MFLRVLYITIMAFSAKHLLHWRKSAKKAKTKKRIETLSTEWDQLTQYVILLEQTAFQEASHYEKSCNELQSKIAQLNCYKESFEDLRQVMTELIASNDIKPKEFQSVSSEMLEVICELNRVQKEVIQLQQDFAVLYGDREEKVNAQQSKINETKSRIAQIETELSTLKLSS